MRDTPVLHLTKHDTDQLRTIIKKMEEISDTTRMMSIRSEEEVVRRFGRNSEITLTRREVAELHNAIQGIIGKIEDMANFASRTANFPKGFLSQTTIQELQDNPPPADPKAANSVRQLEVLLTRFFADILKPKMDKVGLSISREASHSSNR